MNGQSKAQRIAAARAALAAKRAADPAAVQRFEARMAKLADVRRREQQRVDHLVLNRPRPKAATGKRARKGKVQPVTLVPGVEEEVALREDWSHKRATPQTMRHAVRTHADSLDQLERNGTITRDQREWAAEIANVYRSIEADVGVKVASLEARVDNDGRSGNRVAESVKRVRLHAAYTHWRSTLTRPALVLDMIVGDAIGYTVAAVRHRIDKVRARDALLSALDAWPACVAHAYRTIDHHDVERANAA